MRRTICCLTILALAGTVSGQAKEKIPDLEKLKAEWNEKVEAKRKADITKLTEMIQDAEKGIAKAKPKLVIGSKKDRATAKKTIESLTEKKKAYEMDREEAKLSDYAAGIRDADVGFFGKVRDGFIVSQVVDEANVLIKCNTETWWIVTDTSKMADGDKVRISGFMFCPGTKKYNTVLGASRTVRVLVHIPD